MGWKEGKKEEDGRSRGDRMDTDYDYYASRTSYGAIRGYFAHVLELR